MTNPLHNQSRPLITGLAQAGIDLGEDVLAARKAQQDALTFLAPYTAAANTAVAALRSSTDFRKRSDALVKATANLQAAQASNPTVQTAAESNLLDAINASVGNYDGQLVSMFGSIVDEHRLNLLARSLPDFTVDGMKLDILSLNSTQAAAVLAWKAASERLQPIWAAYVRLSTFQGYTLGPVGMDSLWTNRLTAVCLGANTSAESMLAAQVFVAADANVEQSREIRPLLPFVASAIAGFDLQLRPTVEANDRLREFGAVQAPGSLPVGVS
jgi:hypothetical protein